MAQDALHHRTRGERIDRDINGAGLEDPEYRDNTLEASWQADSDALSGKDPISEEENGEAVRPGRELFVGQVFLQAAESHPVRVGGGNCINSMRQQVNHLTA
jgi:hypothetical protein